MCIVGGFRVYLNSSVARCRRDVCQFNMATMFLGVHLFSFPDIATSFVEQPIYIELVINH